MYKCNICSKEYISEDRYILHKKKCEKKGALNVDESMIIKNLKDEINYMKESSIKDRSIIRDEYSNKLKKHKEAIDKKHNIIVNDLKKNIRELQIKLDESIEYNKKNEIIIRDKIKDDLESNFKSREHKLLYDIEKYKNETEFIKRQFELKNNEISKLNEDSELYIKNYESNREKDIKSILNEKNALIAIIKNTKESYDNIILNLKNENENKINDIESKCQNLLQKQQATSNENIKILNKKMEEQKIFYESKLLITNEDIKKAIELEIERSNKAIKDINSQKEKILEAERHSNNLRIESFKKEIDTLKEELNLQNKVSNELVSRKEKELNTSFKITLDELNNDRLKLKSDIESFKKEIESKNEDMNNLKSKLNKTIEDYNNKVKDEDIIKNKLMINKESYLDSLNKLYEENTKNIKEKDKHISILDNKLKMIDDEYKNKILYFNNIINDDKVNIKELSKDLERYKSEIASLNVKINNLEETKERLLTNFENNVQERLTKEYEIIKSHVESEFIKKPPKHIENEIENRNKRIKELENNINTVKEDCKIKVNMLSNEKDNIKIEYDNKLKESKNELNTSKEKYNKSLNTITKDYEDRISIHRKDNEQKLKEIDDLNLKIYNISNDYNNKLNKLEKVYLENNKLQKDELSTKSKELYTITQDYNKISSEYKVYLRSYEEKYKDFNNRIQEYVEKDKKMSDEIINLKSNESKFKHEVDKILFDSNNKLNSLKKIIEDNNRDYTNNTKSLENQISILKDSYEKEKNELLNKVKTSFKDIKDKEDYYINKIKEFENRENIFADNINNLNDEINILKQTIIDNKNNYISELNGQGPPKYRLKIEELEKELDRINKTLTLKDNAIIQLSIEIDSLKDEIKSENMKYEKRELEYNSIIRDLKQNAGSKNEYEDKIKKMRDEWLQAINKQKTEITNYKDITNKLSEKIKSLELISYEKQNELTSLTTIHDDMKKNLLKTLNNQKLEKDSIILYKDKQIDKKDKRISELEELLNNAIQKIP